MNKKEIIEQYDKKAKEMRDAFINALNIDESESEDKFEITYPKKGSAIFRMSHVKADYWTDVFYPDSSETVNMYKYGLYFDSPNEARRHLEELRLLFELKQFAKEVNTTWSPTFDISGSDNVKYVILYDRCADKFNIIHSFEIEYFSKIPYFKSISAARECVKIFGERIKRILPNEFNYYKGNED